MEVKVAIIVPCYNSMKYLDQCIGSVLNQDYKNCVVYAYDNESTDGTYEKLLEMCKSNERLKVIQVPNLYPNSYREAFEHAFENIEADYFTFVASDDWVSLDYVSNCMNIIRKAPSKIKCLQSPIVGSQNGVKTNPQAHRYNNLSNFKNLCLQKSPVNTPTVFYHKSLFPFLDMAAHSHHELSCSGTEDYDMYCNLADNNIFIYPFPQHLGYFYRWHDQQCTWKVHAEKANINYDRIIQNYWEKRWTK